MTEGAVIRVPRMVAGQDTELQLLSWAAVSLLQMSKLSPREAMWHQFPRGCASSLCHRPMGKKSGPSQCTFYGTPPGPSARPTQGLSLGPHACPLLQQLCQGTPPTVTFSCPKHSLGVHRWERTGKQPLTNATEVGVDGPPGADAALAHALPHCQFQVQERHALHGEHDDVGHQETTCGCPEPKPGHHPGLYSGTHLTSVQKAFHPPSRLSTSLFILLPFQPSSIPSCILSFPRNPSSSFYSSSILPPIHSSVFPSIQLSLYPFVFLLIIPSMDDMQPHQLLRSFNTPILGGKLPPMPRALSAFLKASAAPAPLPETPIPLLS